ncbi:MarR family winged helix-turn-helix transcriptional regulator [Sphingomonas baiyangensis]|uniref:MarR family transcriptional regulator n=1 Tax=Sphingomonas baiyangensis TaxID=2572576 RepID=A0A4U1L3V9_9SPHN|nr:MarR family transcriptional regulator [Sphingomonas baiyangensis]TKD51601.1 MarR family transcriptional regulator [Sphingomonas baiyangensis]
MDQPLTIATLRALRTIMRATDLGNRKLAAATGLTPSQLLILREIGEQGETTPTWLSTALHFSQATVTSICDRLEAAGLITREREDQDKRRIRLTATEAGRQAVARAPDLLQQRFEQDFPALPAWEQALVLAGLERLCDVLGIAGGDAAPLLDPGLIDRP